jgi:WD40 repeat protein
MKELEQIELQLSDKDSEVRINALLDACELGEVGIKLVVQALEDKTRKVRQAALILLAESDKEIAKQALCNYLPFLKMQCLHTISELNLDCKNSQLHHFQHLTIANYSNKLVSYWHLDKDSCHHFWDMAKGELEECLCSRSNQYALTKDGKRAIFSYYDFLFWAKVEEAYKCSTGLSNYFVEFEQCNITTESPTYDAHAVCSRKNLVAIGNTFGGYRGGELQIVDYEKNTILFQYSFGEYALSTHYVYTNTDNPEDLWKKNLSPLMFTPDDKILIAHFVLNRLYSTIKLWNINSGELIQTIENTPKLIITSVGLYLDRTIIVCGIKKIKFVLGNCRRTKLFSLRMKYVLVF